MKPALFQPKFRFLRAFCQFSKFGLRVHAVKTRNCRWIKTWSTQSYLLSKNTTFQLYGKYQAKKQSISFINLIFFIKLVASGGAREHSELAAGQSGVLHFCFIHSFKTTPKLTREKIYMHLKQWNKAENFKNSQHRDFHEKEIRRMKSLLLTGEYIFFWKILSVEVKFFFWSYEALIRIFLLIVESRC